MALDHAGTEFVPYSRERPRPAPDFEAGDRGWRRERVAVDGVAPEHELVHWVVPEPLGVVRIGMAAPSQHTCAASADP